MVYYTSLRYIDGKVRQTIVDECGKIVNKRPSKEELKGLEKEKLKGVYNSSNGIYNSTNTCDNIKEDGSKCEEKLVKGKAIREKDKNGNKTGRWFCNKCYTHNYDRISGCGHAILRELANSRTGNQNPNSSSAKGDKSQELACKLYEWIDLNKESDNRRSPVDCYDLKTGLYHQVQGRFFDSICGFWQFDLREEHNKEFKDMVCFCYSEDGKTIERIYIIPKSEIILRATVSILKYRKRKGRGWYEQYREDDEEVANANKIMTKK